MAIAMARSKYVLEIESLSGQPIGIGGQPHDSIAVYSDEELRQRLAEAAKNPDLRATWRRT